MTAKHRSITVRHPVEEADATQQRNVMQGASRKSGVNGRSMLHTRPSLTIENEEDPQQR